MARRARNSTAKLELSPEEQNIFMLCMTGLALVYRADVIAVFAQDEQGFFIHARPGLEKDVVKYLRDTDWSRVHLLVQEFIP